MYIGIERIVILCDCSEIKPSVAIVLCGVFSEAGSGQTRGRPAPHRIVRGDGQLSRGNQINIHYFMNYSDQTPDPPQLEWGEVRPGCLAAAGLHL